MLEILGFVAVPAIMIVCYLVAEVYKLKVLEEDYKVIPVLVGVVGAILGILAYLLMPGYLPAENLLEGIAIGIVSGFGSTGIHQLVKQLRSDE